MVSTKMLLRWVCVFVLCNTLLSDNIVYHELNYTLLLSSQSLYEVIKSVFNKGQFKCPVFPIAQECPDGLYHECDVDKDCVNYDNERDTTFKCCADGCDERLCIPLIRPTQATVKTVSTNTDQFKCPIFPPAEECPDKLDHQCSDDKDCAKFNMQWETYKCCIDGCGMRCVPGVPIPFTNLTTTQATKVKTVGVNTGQFKCPIFPPAEECPDEDYLSHDCNVDKDCVNFNNEMDITHKCCLDGCEKRCVPAIGPPSPSLTTTQATTVKTVGINTDQFKCPAFPLAEECPDELDHECNENKDCAKLNNEMDTYKCCLDGCEKLCVPAVPVPVTNLPTTQATKVIKSVGINTGQFKCPVFPPALECPDEDQLSHECSDDKDCAKLNNEMDTYKCCLDGCERLCVPGIGPITPTTQATAVKNSTDTKDSSPWMKLKLKLD